jgi:hypothetical protein
MAWNKGGVAGGMSRQDSGGGKDNKKTTGHIYAVQTVQEKISISQQLPLHPSTAITQ